MKRTFTQGSTRDTKRYRRSNYKAVARAVPRPLRIANAVHTFHRETVPVANIIENASSDYHVGLGVSLSGLPNYDEFTKLFDQYRITRWEIFFSFDRNGSECGDSGTQRGLPYLTVVRDFDDANVLTTLAAYSQYDPCYHTRLDKPLIKYSIVPHIAMAAYSGAFTSYANRQLQWIDVGSADVIHYGYKYAVTPPVYGDATHTIGLLRVWHRITIQCRQVR